jgi:hypothetical protein
MSQKWVIAIAAVWLGFGAVSAAQDRATVQMRDGSKFEGRIEELTANGELFVRVSLHDQRRVNVANVALIDKAGGASGLPDTEVREAVGSQHLLLLSNGSSLKGQLVAIRGGEGSANATQPRQYVFRADGREQTFGPEQVARVYLGSYPFAAITGNVTNPVQQPTADAGATFRVPANGGWVSTGMRVQSGELIAFTTSGEVQLSRDAGDRGRSAGVARLPGRSATLPNVNAGALIGRVGNSEPFGIGDQETVPMPASGILYLIVNDDSRRDNSGEFVVSVARR